MTASAPAQPRTARRERTIIERPRLLRLLDETSAKTVLLLAPAGYGKTTLARQWAKTLQRAVWLSLAPAHRDVAALAHDFAEAIDAAGGRASGLIGEHLKAHSNPQRAARELGRALVGCLEAADVRWLVLDEYEDIAGAGAEALVETVVRHSVLRVLITSRVRPEWSTGRSVVYGDVEEIGQADLAMTDDEVRLVLKPNHAGARIAERAQGWPAVVGLAAAVEPDRVPSDTLPESLHRYLAEELYQRASERLQEQLVTLALLSDTSQRALEARFGDEAASIIAEATDLGFGSGNETFELHPLLREFLLGKLAQDADAASRVEDAIAAHLDAEAWERAFELIVRFKRWDDVEGALRFALNPLVRTGRLETLASFVAEVKRSDEFPAPSVEVALAELALRDGRHDLARDLIERVERRLCENHPLRSRAAAIEGHAIGLSCDWRTSVAAFERASSLAVDDRDEADALFGLAVARTHGELDGAKEGLETLAKRRHSSPYNLVRYVTAELSLRRLNGDPKGITEIPGLDDARNAAAHVDDPRARSALHYVAAGLLAQAARYTEAQEWLDLAIKDIEVFDLGFAWPLIHWLAGQIALGQRRFAATERALRLVEDAALTGREAHHVTNARCLRARLLLQNDAPHEALDCVVRQPDARHFPSWTGEYLATRAIALACLGATGEALETAAVARQTSVATDVNSLAQTARAIALADTSPDEGRRAVEMAVTSNVWDPLVCGLRSSVTLADQLASDPVTRLAIADLYQRLQETALARRAGLKLRATRPANEILTSREQEVLALVARGYRTQDISKTLFIADSTTKVHIRHIFEKLGARTRSEAVARFQMLEQ
jgi:LuxR family transcriptional regulator, maltose regulon positive regulatory protein